MREKATTGVHRDWPRANDSSEEAPLNALCTELPSAVSVPAAPAVAVPTFDHIYRAHRGRVLATIRNVLGPTPEHELEDVVQLVFIEVFRCLDRFEGRSKLTTWLYRIAVNVALQHIRKKKRKRWLTLGLTGDELGREPSRVNANTRLEDRQMLRLVYEAVATLSEKKRAVWVLHELQGLSPHAISDVLEIPMNTVRSRLLAGRRVATRSSRYREGAVRVRPTLGRPWAGFALTWGRF